MASSFSFLTLVVYAVVHVGFIGRAILVHGKTPMSRTAWVLAILMFPVLGILAYVLFGEVRVSQALRQDVKLARATLADTAFRDRLKALDARDQVPPRYRPAFELCASINSLCAVSGNAAELPPDSNAAIARLVEDINAARETVHISFYIWLTDGNGLKVVDAVKRAAQRGVACRVMADALGSRDLIHSAHWQGMVEIGVKVQESLRPFRTLLPLKGTRLDLRNHRKIVVIDNTITYVGSQNCADPEFRVKPKFAPWVDVLLRVTGPVAMEHQYLFAADWMAEAGEDLSPLFKELPPKTRRVGFPALVFGVGPTTLVGMMSDAFAACLATAEEDVVISTPYFAPDQPLMAGLIAAARRGVKVIMIFPARNDSREIGYISRSCYDPLLAAGVAIYEYKGGLLHAKTLVVDGVLTLIGSANMDRRSLELNFENNMLLFSKKVSALLRERQDHYLADCTRITVVARKNVRLTRRFMENVVAMASPLF